MADQTINPRRSWDRKPDESTRAWTAFVAFRDSADRKLINVAKSLTPACSVQNVSRWSVRHSWAARSADWDTHVDEEQRSELSRGRVARRRRQLQLASALQSVAAHALREIQAKIEMKLPLGWAPEQIAGLVKVADQLEASAFGSEKENRFTAINLVVSTYADEEAYEAELKGLAPLSDEGATMMTMDEFQRRQYERLSDEERRSLDGWKNPPKPKLN
jgi:hypothetical protein